ncbi:hypothetical protein CAEBREN_14714 [Caenorhabditis brenneri]|uniref:G-protein coupled receptors family 1 profile domain-containing protein n=1 Tax=Caenorhabditis brenneri TaxID=135651 RepID=G0NJ34_CAEBE|nr:hypothetical protein CAEBREN_14714 [Caenorhabditis brenneri]
MPLVVIFYILYLLMIFAAFGFLFILFISVYTYRQKGIYNNLGEYLTLFDYHVYTYPLLLTVLMIIERIYVIFSPFGKAFTDRKLWLYCFLLAITLLILLLIPFYSGCAVNYSFYTFDYSTECDPDGHFITYIFDTYTGVIPLGCLVLNFALIFYISQKRKRIDNTGNGKLNARQSHEKTLLIQSISSTTFLLIYEITEKATDIFSDEYEALPGFTRRMIYYARAGSVAFTCFFIYFVGTPSIRKIIMTKVLRLMRRERKQPSRMLTTWNSRDVSTMF